jgi:hypothetical protein
MFLLRGKYEGERPGYEQVIHRAERPQPDGEQDE